MGKLLSKITKTQKKLPPKNDLSPNEVYLLHDYYLKASGGDRVISFQEFIDLFAYLNPHLTGPDIVKTAERAFMETDVNYDGFITYDEFEKSYKRSKQQQRTPFYDNLLALLRLNSKDHKRAGYLNSEEANTYLSWIHNYYGTPNIPLKIEIFKQKFVNNKSIPYQEFVDFIEPYYRKP